MRLPTFFIPHGGGPCFFMDWQPAHTWTGMAEFLTRFIVDLPEPPSALLVISAHWEAQQASVTTHPHPPLIYDYFGFPEHTYRLTWPAPGAPELAAKVQNLLSAANIMVTGDTTRGFDHGTFIPLKLAVPQAHIPTVQLSLVAGLSPAHHLAIGRALAPLRDQGVLIIGSGMSYHNLRAFGPEGAVVSEAFDRWLRQAVNAPDQLQNWKDAPSARAAHPREEHLLPLMVVAGAGGIPSVPYEERVLGMALSAFRFD